MAGGGSRKESAGAYGSRLDQQAHHLAGHPLLFRLGEKQLQKFEAIRSFDNITGFTHIFESVLPKLKARGVSEDEIHTLLVKIRLVFSRRIHILACRRLELIQALYPVPMFWRFGCVIRRKNG